MSFSYDTKNELCRLPVQKLCCARAEAYGILLFCNTFSATEVRIITENPHFAARLPKLFRRAFNLQFDRQPEPEQEEGKRIFQITDQKKLDHIINLLGFDPQQNLVLHINFGMVEETCDRAAFLRGAFFAGGSITDPQKRYHLELTTSHLQVSRELGSLLQECGYPPKNLSRGGSLITYFKQSDQIEDFLTLIGAPVAAMNVMSAKLEKDLRNSVNRRLNCDSANLDKSVEAAQEQMEAIRRLQAAELLEQLPDKLQETAAGISGTEPFRAGGGIRPAGEQILSESPAAEAAGAGKRSSLIKRKEEFEMNRCEQAAAYHKKGFNCCQSVLAAFQDVIGLTETQCLTLGGGFGAGAGTGELCGAVTGAVMVLDLLTPADPADVVGSKKKAMAQAKELQKRFAERFDALRCADLLQKKFVPDDTTPAAKALGLTGHCDIMIATAVEIVEQMIAER